MFLNIFDYQIDDIFGADHKYNSIELRVASLFRLGGLLADEVAGKPKPKKWRELDLRVGMCKEWRMRAHFSAKTMGPTFSRWLRTVCPIAVLVWLCF